MKKLTYNTKSKQFSLTKSFSDINEEVFKNYLKFFKSHSTPSNRNDLIDSLAKIAEYLHRPINKRLPFVTLDNLCKSLLKNFMGDSLVYIDDPSDLGKILDSLGYTEVPAPKSTLYDLNKYTDTFDKIKMSVLEDLLPNNSYFLIKSEDKRFKRYDYIFNKGGVYCYLGYYYDNLSEYNTNPYKLGKLGEIIYDNKDDSYYTITPTKNLIYLDGSAEDIINGITNIK